jgi:adenylate cyclase
MARPPSATAGAGRSHRRASRWRATLGHSLPVVGVSLVMLLVATIAYYVYEANRHGATALSNDLVTAIEQRIVVQMRAYLEPAQRLLELADTGVDGRPVFEAQREAERYARHALTAVPSVSAVSFADADGNYLFVLRNDRGSFDTKLVDLRGGRRVTWIRRDKGGEVIATADDPTDTFDARERPWFKAAADARRPVWTDTYQFFTIRKPGLTFALPRFGSDGRLLTVMALRDGQSSAGPCHGARPADRPDSDRRRGCAPAPAGFDRRLNASAPDCGRGCFMAD